MKKEAILLIGHGSQLNFNKEVLELQAENLRKKGFSDVFIGYNERTAPLAGEMLSEIVQKGYETVYAVPVFIASGVHISRGDKAVHLGRRSSSPPGCISRRISLASWEFLKTAMVGRSNSTGTRPM